MSQRIKGNAKPSNSERASRLLENRGFVSFSEASQALSSIYSSKVPNNTDASLSNDYDICPEFQVVFKHMAKKDINTKLKALKDFVVLCRDKDKGDLLKIAKFWYRIYRKLANTIDWRIREDVHNAHRQFLSAFDRTTMIDNLQSVSCSVSSGSAESGEVSFQNLVTMPAVMWTACYDSYTQPSEAAQQAFSLLYQNPNQRAQFLLANYEVILNYCIYCIFETVPIGLFYSTSLPKDSVKLFEEHLLVTNLLGLSSMVNELLCYYYSIGDSLKDDSQVFDCLEKIFLQLNSEFVKCKGLFTPEPKPVLVEEDEEENVTENGDFQLLSKRDKKKLKKEANLKKKNKDDDPKSGRSVCKFWGYASTENGSVRVAFFQALNSLVRLTTFFSDPKSDGEFSYYEKLNISTRLWFKLYKSNFFDITFKSYVDQMPEVRGLAWIIGSHLLANQPIYNPWSVVNMDKWLSETLQPFVANGMKTPGGITDFALFKIGLHSYRTLFQEFFTKKHEHLSALLMTTGSYSQMDILANVKLVIMFVDAFNQHTPCLKIVNILLDSLKGAFSRAMLSSDMHFLVELYFNLIYYLVQRQECTDQAQFESFAESLVQQNLYSLLISSFDSGKNLLADSQLYLNLLLLAHHTRRLCSTLGDCLISNITKLYERLMTLIDRELQIAKTKFQIDPKMNLLLMLRFFTDSTYFSSDGYFSPSYYYTRKDSNYPKRVLRLMKNPKSISDATEKRVLFQDAETDLVVASSGDYWTDKWKVSNFNYSLLNPDYESSQHKNGPFSLIDSLPTLKERTVQITAGLFKLIDSISKDPQGTQKDETLLLIYHLQLIIRSFTTNEMNELYTRLQNESTPVQYIAKWISYLFAACADLTDHRFLLLIGAKICDLYLVILMKLNEPILEFRKFCLTLNPFAFCLVSRHLDHLCQDGLPMSQSFSSLMNQLNLLIKQIQVNEPHYLQRLLMAQIDTIFANAFDSFDTDVLLNLLTLTLKSKPVEDSAITLTAQVLARFYHSFSVFQVEQIACSTFGMEYPLLSSELYQILFSNPNQVVAIADFKPTLAKFISLIFEQMFASCQHGATLSVFIQNCFTFLKVVFANMFQHFAFYEDILVILLQQLIHFVIDRVIIQATWNVDNFQLINEYIGHFLKLLFVNYENCCDNSLDVKQFYNLQVDLYQKIFDQTQFNRDDYAILCLYALQSENSSRRLFASIDLFSNSENLPKLTDSCQLNQYIEKQLDNLEHSIYLHSALANVIEQLLENIYFDSNYQKMLPADDPTIFGTNFDQSHIYIAIQTLFLNFYHFRSFSELYFAKNNRKEKEKEQKREVVSNLLDCLQEKIDSICKLLNKVQNHNMTEFCSFIVGQKNRQVKLPSLLFADFFFKHFYSANLSSVLNQIDRPEMFNCSFVWNCNDLIWLYLVNTPSIDSITKIVQNAIVSIQTIMVEEQGESEVVKRVVNWSQLELSDVHRTLLILNFALYHTCSNHDATDDLRKELKDFASLVSNSDISTLFKPNLISFDNTEFFTFFQLSCFINKSSELLYDEEEVITQIPALLALFKPMIPVLYAALPEGLEKGTPHQLSSLLWSSLVLEPLRTIIARGKSVLRVEDESHTEAKDLIWNFLVINSYNMLLPVFAVMVRTLDSNFVERSFRQRLIDLIALLDSKILSDMALFEPNEYLLMQPTQVEKRIDVMAEYLEHMTSDQLNTPDEVDQRVMPIEQKSTYYGYIFEHITSLLYEDDYDLSQSAYHLLSIAIEAAPWHCNLNHSGKVDNGVNNLTLSGIDAIQNEIHAGPPKFLSDLLESLDKIVYCTLMEYEFGEPVAIEPHVDVHHFTMAYLLAWLLYLRLVTRFPFKGDVNGEIRTDLVNYLTERGLYAKLLDNLFSLMPSEESRLAQEDFTVERFHHVLYDLGKMREMCGEPRADSLAQLSLCVYYHTVSQVPNLLRSWYNGLKHIPRQVVTSFTTRLFSRLLIEKELDSVHNADKDKFGNITIRISKKTNEISAVYSFKEIEFGIRFNFQDNYPLTPVSIQCFNKSGVSEDRCRKWIQRLTIFFNKMNCSIMDGIIQLRPNMDKFFEGIEECMICLFVLYGVTAQLPKFKCPQCRKKFHSACIRKWFQTHHNSTCPQCKFEFQ